MFLLPFTIWELLGPAEVTLIHHRPPHEHEKELRTSSRQNKFDRNPFDLNKIQLKLLQKCSDLLPL